MKDQINILVLVSILILVGIIFLIVKSLASKPISFPKITFPSKRTIAKEWLILIAAILLGLLVNSIINWRFYEQQVSATQVWQKSFDTAIGFIPDKPNSKPDPLGIESQMQTNEDDVMPSQRKPKPLTDAEVGLLPPQPPKPELRPPEISFIFLIILVVYFVRSIVWAITTVKVGRNN